MVTGRDLFRTLIALMRFFYKEFVIVSAGTDSGDSENNMRGRGNTYLMYL